MKMLKHIDWFGIVLASAIVLTPITSYAQVSAMPKPDVILRVSPDELNIISEGLQTQPFGKVVPLINKLQAQILEQQKASEAPKVETPKE